mmetsp:Transcript_45419/g.140457  ORF Transcript_45419/g.140457 Transcript_45419/m.140457 type:complete len:177 (+) Transcript_45419:1-531(+)
MELNEEKRWGLLLFILHSPFFARCRTESGYAEVNFATGKAALRFAREDPQLRQVSPPSLLSRWFVEESGDVRPASSPQTLAQEQQLISVVRLGDDDLVRWDVVVPKSCTVADLRQRLSEVFGLDAKAARQMRFAMQKGQNFASMVDSEKVRKAMAVVGIQGDWPPPPDPAAADFTA